MHREILDFIKATKVKHPELFVGVKVIEAGSLIINGSVRPYFSEDCEYYGVDAKDGNGVDWWGVFHEWEEKADDYFDVAVSTEVLEHDPFWRMTLNHMVRKVKPEGALIITTAGPARHPHGVKYYEDAKDPTIQRAEYHPWGPLADYYFAPPPEMILWELLHLTSFEYLEYSAMRDGQDLCFICKGMYDLKPNYYGRGQIALLKKYNRTKIEGNEKKY